MTEASYCESCRWWRRLGATAPVGECGNDHSGYRYTNQRGWCARHQPVTPKTPEPRRALPPLSL